jgi:hypothetical protein
MKLVSLKNVFQYEANDTNYVYIIKILLCNFMVKVRLEIRVRLIP